LVKRQHYVPRFYLKGFVGLNHRLCTYSKSRRNYFDAKPEGICVESYLYEVSLRNACEASGGRFLAQGIVEKALFDYERSLAGGLQSFLTCCEAREYDSEAFSRGRLAVCRLIANLIVRHPRLLNDDRSKAHDLACEHFSSHKLDRALLRDLGLEAEADSMAELAIIVSHLFPGASVLPVARIISGLDSKSVVILEAPSGTHFITTSSPFFFEGIDEENYDFSTAYMPLSSRYAVLFRCSGDKTHSMLLSMGKVACMNAALLGENPIWEYAMACTRGSLEKAVRDYECAYLDD